MKTKELLQETYRFKSDRNRQVKGRLYEEKQIIINLFLLELIILNNCILSILI